MINETRKMWKVLPDAWVFYMRLSGPLAVLNHQAKDVLVLSHCTSWGTVCVSFVESVYNLLGVYSSSLVGMFLSGS